MTLLLANERLPPVSAIGPSPKVQAITQVSHASSTHSKKRTASGDLPQKASKTQILLSKEPHKAVKTRVDQLEDSEADRPIMEDQAQIEAEGQIGHRTLTEHGLLGLILSSHL